MRITLVGLLLVAMAVPALAVEGAGAVYAGGTVATLKDGVAGNLELTSNTALEFIYTGGRLEIPYDGIESYEQTQELAVHLGVAPTIAVALVKHLRRNHFVRITFKDGANQHQVAVFEISKTMPRVLMPTLAARAIHVHAAASGHINAKPASAAIQK